MTTWDELEDVDDWDAVGEHPPRRAPVREKLLGVGVWKISVRREKFE
jgi:hypothetical protein